METKDIALLAVTLIILGEVTYLLAKLPKTSIKTKNRAILVDTSVLMDGRVTSIARTGFIGGTLVVPRSVIGELQFLADNADADKRARARYGLDVVADLQKMEGVEVEILQDGSKAAEGVDERLLTLAKRHGSVILTLDYNLNKVAAVEGIGVLNINELAQSLRMSHLPGEHMMIELTQKGQDSHQAVGHLPDGTMVVVEQSSSMIGQQVLVEVVRSLQTAAGKMMFAKRVTESPSTTQHKKPAMQVAQKAKSAGRSVVQSTPKKKTAVQDDATTHPKSQPSSETHTPKRHQQNSRRTYHATPQQSAHKATTLEKSTATPRRQPKRRKDHEATLLALVDKQQD
jgi:rRNA-processing protein FCF1